MTHTEYKLIVKEKIYEKLDSTTKAIAYSKGDTIVVDKPTFKDLQSGQTIERFTIGGIIRFDKYNFENEVESTSVTIEYGTRKLGQRKNK